jgi:hypothetical protein
MGEIPEQDDVPIVLVSTTTKAKGAAQDARQ